MRKSERLRLLEMELIRTQFELEALKATIQFLLDSVNLNAPTLDAGKWYTEKLQNLKNNS